MRFLALQIPWGDKGTQCDADCVTGTWIHAAKLCIHTAALYCGALFDGGNGDAVARPHGQQAAQDVLALRRQHHILRYVILARHNFLQDMSAQSLAFLIHVAFRLTSVLQ